MPSARKSNRMDQQKKELKRGGGGVGYDVTNRPIAQRLMTQLTIGEKSLSKIDEIQEIVEKAREEISSELKNYNVRISDVAVNVETIKNLKSYGDDALKSFIKFKYVMYYLKNTNNLENSIKINIIKQLVVYLQEVVTEVQKGLRKEDKREEGEKERDEGEEEEGEGETDLDNLKNTAKQAIENAKKRAENPAFQDPLDVGAINSQIEDLKTRLNQKIIKQTDIEQIIEEANKIAILSEGGKKSKRNGGGRCVMSPEMTKILTTGHLF